jgi:hypothetical protein
VGSEISGEGSEKEGTARPHYQTTFLSYSQLTANRQNIASKAHKKTAVTTTITMVQHV